MFINDLPLYLENVALQMLSLWCKRDGMLLNTAKTKVMLIIISQKRFRLHGNFLNLTNNSDVLKNVNNDKVLDAFIDNNLTWPIYMQSISKKKFFKFVASIKTERVFSLENRVHFYKTYIQPQIDYCSTVWGGTSHFSLNRIYRLQQRAVRIILDYEYTDIACSMNELKTINEP